MPHPAGDFRGVAIPFPAVGIAIGREAGGAFGKIAHGSERDGLERKFLHEAGEGIADNGDADGSGGDGVETKADFEQEVAAAGFRLTFTRTFFGFFAGVCVHAVIFHCGTGTSGCPNSFFRWEISQATMSAICSLLNG